MNKFIFVASVAMLSLCSCSNDNTDAPLTEREITLGAGIEDNATSRSNFTNTGSFFWTNNDKIAVYTTGGNFRAFTISSGQGTSNATFTGTITGDPTSCAVYPSTAAKSLSGTTLTVALPSVYLYNSQQSDYASSMDASVNSANMPMVAKIDDGSSLNSKHIGGAFCFKFKDVPANTKKITFTTNSQVCGQFTVDLTSSNPIINTSESEDRSLKSVSVLLSSVSDSKTDWVVYFPVPCGTYSGYEVTMLDSSGNQLTQLKSDKVKTITRGKAVVFDAYTIEEEEEEEESYDETGTLEGHDYVDLGLSVKWATCNIGASSPSDYGDYFAWGQTETKESFVREDSCWGYDINTLKGLGVIDDNRNLTFSYDAATENWGGVWRMPTEDEIVELDNKCIWTRTTQNGNNGYKVTGPNGNSIFLPAAGCRYGSDVESVGSCGVYWSATASRFSDSACCLIFEIDIDLGWSDYPRLYGQSVRPVAE